MQFKKWLLLNEAGFEGGGEEWFFGNLLLPSDAFDWQYAHPFPSDFFLMKKRWKKDREHGRKFINIDLEDVLNTKFTSIHSRQLPDNERWTHKPDGGPILDVDFNADIRPVLKAPDKWLTNKDFDRNDELNSKFGKFTPKYYELPKDFDEPWIKSR